MNMSEAFADWGRDEESTEADEQRRPLLRKILEWTADRLPGLEIEFSEEDIGA